MADAAALPLADRSVNLVTACTSLHDVDGLEAAVREIARVMRPDATLAVAIVHPINSAGAFESSHHDAEFRIGTYLDEGNYVDVVERDGLRMRFAGRHRPLETYFATLGAAGLVVERLVEIPDRTEPPGGRWRRVPLFLHLRARPSADAGVVMRPALLRRGRRLQVKGRATTFRLRGRPDRR